MQNIIYTMFPELCRWMMMQDAPSDETLCKTQERTGRNTQDVSRMTGKS